MGSPSRSGVRGAAYSNYYNYTACTTFCNYYLYSTKGIDYYNSCSS